MSTITNIFESKRYHLTILTCIYLYVLFNIAAPSIATFFKTVFILGTIGIFYNYRKSIFKDPIILLLGLALTLQVVSWYNSIIYIPDLANQAPKLDRLAKLFLFFLIAYWLQGSIKKVYILWGCYSIGFILALLTKSDNFFHEFYLGMSGVRVDFNIKNAQYTSMFSGVCLILSIFFYQEIRRKNEIFSNVRIRKTLTIITAISALFFLIMVIITQSRMVWLGLLLVLFIIPIAYSITYRNSNFKKLIVSYLVIVALAISALFTSLPYFESRSKDDIKTINQVINLDFDNIPMSSAGIRINSWIEASKWVVAHPLIGLDAKAPELVITESELFKSRRQENETIIEGLSHLHNFHIEILVAYGVLGLTLIYLLYFYISLSLYKIKNNEINSILLFSIIFIVYWLCINFFESFNSRSYGVFTHNIILAGLYAFVIQKYCHRDTIKCE